MFEKTLDFTFNNTERVYLKSEFVELGRSMQLWRVLSSGHQIHLKESNKLTYLVPTVGRLDVLVRQTEYRAEAGGSLLFSPNERTTRVTPLTSGEDYEALVILLSEDRIERMMPGNDQVNRDIALALAADIERGASLRSYTHFLGNEIARPMSALTREHMLAGAAALLEELFIALLEDENAVTRRLSSGVAYVNRAEELMREYFGDAISMKDLADRMNISLRSLQIAFRQHRDCAPRDRLNEIRLREARARLLKANKGASVSDIAFDCGFTHLGRFSAAYRKAFGELPSETLR